MKEKVVFDTNAVNNEDSNFFFGNRKELELFSQNAEIIIPKIVIEEIRRKKTKKLINKRRSFMDNPFHNLKGLKREETAEYNIDEFIQTLLDSEKISFRTIELKNNSVFEEIKELALKKLPPFEKSDDTDKGFKDALIYFAIKEYINEIPDKYIFVCVNDGRFKEALNKHSNIIIVKNYEEFKSKSISQYFDDYFIQKVNEFLKIELQIESIQEYWYNLNDNHVVLLKHENDEYTIEVDSGEIISGAVRSEFSNEIQKLISSENFNTTDKYIDYLQPFVQLFSLEEVENILIAAYDNTQIRWIIKKEAIKEFIGPFYLANKDLVNGKHHEFLKDIFE